MVLLHTRYNTAHARPGKSRGTRKPGAILVRIRDDLQALSRDGRLEGQRRPFTDERSLES